MGDLPRFRDLTAPSRFTFVRHGESEANQRGEIQGHSDSPLSATGRDHARAAGRWLSGTGVELVFTSPLARSHETARILAETAGAPAPIVLDELKELDTGVYSGRNLSENREMDPKAFSQFRIHSWDAVSGAESRESLMRRAQVVWDRLVGEANDSHRHIVCVTHGGMLQWLIKATLGGSEHRWMPIFGMANCGISTFQVESTSLGVEEELPPNTGFVGTWKQINLVPY